MRSIRPRSPISAGIHFPRLLDPEFRARAPSYLFQCGLATAFLIAILLLENAVLRAAIVVAVASSAATIFVVPDSVAATPRRVVGGHVVAVVVAGAFSTVAGVPGESTYLLDVMAALSVGLSILIMVSTDTEHPPAAGTALGLVIYGWSPSAVFFILSSVIFLSLVRIVLRPRLINLL
ncbi:MAG: HPP family protein [Chloroflexi bacterium]|nr:HPP family protein [Chloroflexota bacterium]